MRTVLKYPIRWLDRLESKLTDEIMDAGARGDIQFCMGLAHALVVCDRVSKRLKSWAA